ncbi:MAG: hypothetical protein EPN97_09145 [Alphaproteobacteria bacterium]|nr:MAG: hypothetical protein EPN97_09145 [Alphaproteobacteria bacterium]
MTAFSSGKDGLPEIFQGTFLAPQFASNAIYRAKSSHKQRARKNGIHSLRVLIKLAATFTGISGGSDKLG